MLHLIKEELANFRGYERYRNEYLLYPGADPAKDAFEVVIDYLRSNFA